MHKAFSGVNYIPLVERSVMFRELIPVCQSDRWGGGGVTRCFTRTVTGVILTWTPGTSATFCHTYAWEVIWRATVPSLA